MSLWMIAAFLVGGACSEDKMETGQTLLQSTGSDTNGEDTGDVANLPDAQIFEDSAVVEEDSTIDDELEIVEDAGVSDDVTEEGDAGSGDSDSVTSDIEVPPVDSSDNETSDSGNQSLGEQCFSEIWDKDNPGPNYDQFDLSVGSHCYGTDFQAIKGVEEVVFLGDSVTVGTPNLEFLLNVQNEHFYRNKLADWLADEFQIDKGDDWTYGVWKTYDYFSGKGGVLAAGDFRNCSKWGARTDDLTQQLGDCFVGGQSDAVTLVLFTMGGNDVAKINKSGGDATEEEISNGYPKAWELAKRTIEYLEDAIKWLKDPTNLSNGAYVVFANPFEFTDGTGKTDSCKPQINIGGWDLGQSELNLAELSGFKPWKKPEVQTEIMIWLLEEYMRIAVENQVDMVWMLERFCGHGFVATGPNADSETRCYLGPDTPVWFDVTCYHPNKKGHNAIYEMFKAVIAE